MQSFAQNFCPLLAHDREFPHKHSVVANTCPAKEHIILLDSRIHRTDREIKIRVSIDCLLLWGVGTFSVRPEVQIYFVLTDGGTCDYVPPFGNEGKLRRIDDSKVIIQVTAYLSTVVQNDITAFEVWVRRSFLKSVEA